MSCMTKTRQQLSDVANNFILKVAEKNDVTQPNPGNETTIRQAGVSTSNDGNKSLWERLWKIIVDAWHQLVKTIIKG